MRSMAKNLTPGMRPPEHQKLPFDLARCRDVDHGADLGQKVACFGSLKEGNGPLDFDNEAED